MVEYKCKRCHYIAKQKSNYNDHLHRKNPCKAIYSTITIKELIDELNKPKKGYVCNKCNKVFKTKQSKYQHQKRCKMDLVVKEAQNKRTTPISREETIEEFKTILEKDPLEKVCKKKKLAAFKHYGFWQCVDTKRDLDRLKKILK